MDWEEEPLATPENQDDALRSDFRKNFILGNGEELIVQIEVEMGNAASSYRNYFKFQLSYSYGLTDICVIILPTTQLSVRIDSGVSSFEKTVREIPSAKLSMTVPTLVIGLDNTDVTPWDIKEATSYNIGVAKGANKHTSVPHIDMVSSYID